MRAQDTTFRGQEVKLVTLTPEEAERLDWLPTPELHERLATTGLDLRKTLHLTNDSDGTVYYYTLREGA